MAVARSLIAEGVVTSRSELAQHLGVSASTASLLVKGLVADGHVEEVGAGESTGGRRPTLLRAVTPDGTIAVAELGSKHVRLALCDLSGGIVVLEEVGLDIGSGPVAVLKELTQRWSHLADSAGADPPLAATVALPGPVSILTGEVIGPSRMPGWRGTQPATILRELLGVPTVMENDARAAALGEHLARPHRPGDLIYVKAGSGIGAGFVASGRLFQGGDGVAGDIAHVRVVDDPATFCACGQRGCLEAVASGAAIRQQLLTEGLAIGSTSELVSMGQALHPQVSAAMRTAGDRLGRALAPLVNFLNPPTVVIGGAMSGVDSFMASIRSSLYDYCLPMCTQNLAIEVVIGGPNAALRGLALLGRQLALAS